ncbi:unnamed protein product [Ranitomeya imitator]|uniref:Profilin n=1 Tax=Ranitomeya imitator TaxID=111125 RepID=A0ABN9MII3_9NEOB|nr:unnamed protein product [Ranitomeya imitator]
MSWQDYITNLMGPDMRDAVICGYKPFSVWAAQSGGELCKITAAEVNALVSEDHSSLLHQRSDDRRYKVQPPQGTTSLTPSHWMSGQRRQKGQPLIVLMGKDGTHGGVLNTKVHAVAKYLRDQKKLQIR